MQIPTTLRIAGLDYSVVLTKNPEVGNNVCFGTCTYGSCTIELNNDPTIAPGKLQQTLLHEILHAVWYHTSLNEDDGEERIIDALSKGLFQVISDNPGVFAPLKKSPASG